MLNRLILGRYRTESVCTDVHLSTFFTRQLLKPAGPLKALYEAKGLTKFKETPGLVASFSHTGWWHTQTIQHYQAVFGDKFVVSNISMIFQSKLDPCFEHIVTELAKLRLQAAEQKLSIQQLIIKSLSNNTYGYMIKQLDNLVDVDVVPNGGMAGVVEGIRHVSSVCLIFVSESVMLYIADFQEPLFQSFEDVPPTDRYWEVTREKKTVRSQLPVVVGLSILSQAKTYFTDIVYNFFGKYMRASSFEILYCEYFFEYTSRKHLEQLDIFRRY